MGTIKTHFRMPPQASRCNLLSLLLGHAYLEPPMGFSFHLGPPEHPSIQVLSRHESSRVHVKSFLHTEMKLNPMSQTLIHEKRHNGKTFVCCPSLSLRSYSQRKRLGHLPHDTHWLAHLGHEA